MTLSETIELIGKAMEGVTHPDAPEWISVDQDGNGPNGGFWTCAAATTESPRYIRADFYAAFAREAEALKRRAEAAEALADRLKQEAQFHAQEARAANSTIYEIYQVVSGGTGEPGNWHGAEPVREKLEALKRENAELREQMGYWQRGHERIQECLDECVKADPLDAPIPLIGVEAKRWHAYRAEAFRHALEMIGIPEEFRARALLSKESADAQG